MCDTASYEPASDFLQRCAYQYSYLTYIAALNVHLQPLHAIDSSDFAAAADGAACDMATQGTGFPAGGSLPVHLDTQVSYSMKHSIVMPRIFLTQSQCSPYLCDGSLHPAAARGGAEGAADGHHAAGRAGLPEEAV